MFTRLRELVLAPVRRIRDISRTRARWPRARIKGLAPIVVAAICAAALGVHAYLSDATLSNALGATLIGALVGAFLGLTFSGFDRDDPSPHLRHRSTPPRSLR
jgi:O-antigen ligase